MINGPTHSRVKYHLVILCHIMSYHVASYLLTPDRISSRHARLSHAVSYRVMPYCITSSLLGSNAIMSCFVILRHDIMHHIFLPRAKCHHFMLRHTVSCHNASYLRCSGQIPTCHALSYGVMPYCIPSSNDQM